MTGDCQIPPIGWYCTRRVGHEGPCAALPVVEVDKPDETAYSFPVSQKQAAQVGVWIDKHNEEKHANSMRSSSDGKKHRYAGAIGGAYTWEFTSTSIGMVTVLRCSCGEKIDVSNYDDW